MEALSTPGTPLGAPEWYEIQESHKNDHTTVQWFINLSITYHTMVGGVLSGSPIHFQVSREPDQVVTKAPSS